MIWSILEISIIVNIGTNITSIKSFYLGFFGAQDEIKTMLNFIAL